MLKVHGVTVNPLSLLAGAIRHMKKKLKYLSTSMSKFSKL